MVKEKKRQANDLTNEVRMDPETREIDADKPLSAYTKNDDALNPTLNQKGQGIGTHEVDINSQTDLELGALADPGGIDPAADIGYLENMKRNIAKHQQSRS